MKEFEEQHGQISNYGAQSKDLLMQYAIALARSRTDDVEAKARLYKTIDPSGHLNIGMVARCKVYLARVLRRLTETQAAEEMEAWLVRWFKKNPHRIDDTLLIPMFTTDIDPTTDPVLQGLGGQKWLENRRRTFKTDMRMERGCRRCRKTEPQVQVKQCARCKHTFYCSRECQIADHPYHKESCKEAAQTLRRIEALKVIGAPAEARRYAQWKEFRTSVAHPANGILLAHALGLRRDPSRSHTHIVFKIVEHDPLAKHPHDHFRFTEAGVFKLDDVWPDVEAIMGLDKDEGKQYVDDLLEDFCNTAMQGDQSYPTLALAFHPVHAVEAFLSYGAVTWKTLNRVPYDPDWRGKMNRSGNPPTLVEIPRAGVKDVEHDF